MQTCQNAAKRRSFYVSLFIGFKVYYIYKQDVICIFAAAPLLALTEKGQGTLKVGCPF